MMMSYCTSKEAAQLVTNLPHGSNHLSALNNLQISLQGRLQPFFSHHLPFVASNEYHKAAGKHTHTVFLKIVTESRLVKKLCQVDARSSWKETVASVACDTAGSEANLNV